MLWINIPLETIGGLGLFLYGMHKLSEGLKMAASHRIRNILSYLTKNRYVGLMVGAGITAVIQSSSATSVLVVGFVNAGLLTITQAISVNIGANIGTTFTAWLVSIIGKFNIGLFALPAIGLGFFMRTFCKRRKFIEGGEILLGFGLLFFGLEIMKDAFAPVKKSARFAAIVASFAANPLLGILVGTVFTMVIQSSSAFLAVVQLLAFNGVISFEAAIPLVLGTNIGTTITAELASINTNTTAKITARANTLFNFMGVFITLPFVWSGIYGGWVQAIFPGEIKPTNIMAHIAVAHSLFNIFNAVVFALFIKGLSRAAVRFTRAKPGDAEKQPKYLEENLLDNPVIAMEQVIKELMRMAELAKTAVQNAHQGFFREDPVLLKKAADNEQALDEFQRAITAYLIRISERHLDTRESNEYPVLLHSINDLEKVGDYAVNIISYANIRSKNKLEFRNECVTHIQKMFSTLYELFDVIIASLKTRDNKGAFRAVELEDQIDIMKAQCKENYIRALKRDDIKPESEIMTMDIATNVEKMGDHLISIAKAVIKDLQWGRKIEDPKKP
jgi:phosphate:Na+ symporter